MPSVPELFNPIPKAGMLILQNGTYRIRVFLVSLKKPIRESNLFTKSDITTHYTVFLAKKDMF